MGANATKIGWALGRPGLKNVVRRVERNIKNVRTSIWSLRLQLLAINFGPFPLAPPPKIIRLMEPSPDDVINILFRSVIDQFMSISAYFD
jgi:hypothetical protein